MLLNLDILLIVLGLASLLHIAEEFIYPGGFYTEYNKLIQAFGLNATIGEMVIINALFLGVVALAVIIGVKSLLFVLSVISLILINGLLHLTQSTLKKRYFPGLYTSLFLYIPLGVISFVSFPLSVFQKLTAFFIGLGMHAVPFIVFGVKKFLLKKKRGVNKEDFEIK